MISENISNLKRKLLLENYMHLPQMMFQKVHPMLTFSGKGKKQNEMIYRLAYFLEKKKKEIQTRPTIILSVSWCQGEEPKTRKINGQQITISSAPPREGGPSV